MFYASLIVDSLENEKTRWRSRVLWGSAKLTPARRETKVSSLFRNKKKKSSLRGSYSPIGKRGKMEIHAQQTQQRQSENDE